MNKEQKYFYDLLPGDMPNVDAIKISQYMANQSSLTPKSIRDSEVRKLAEDYYGNDIHLYAKQRDGYVKGYTAALEASLKPNKLSDIETDAIGFSDFIADKWKYYEGSYYSIADDFKFFKDVKYYTPKELYILYKSTQNIHS